MRTRAAVCAGVSEDPGSERRNIPGKLMEQTSMSRATLSPYARPAYIALAIATIALGLTVHLHGEALGPVWRDVIGDIIWGAMITWWVSAIAPRTSSRARILAAVVICFTVEVSQLYHTPGLDTLRSTTMGKLTLGSGFDPRDLVAYVTGVLAASYLERVGRLWLGRRTVSANHSR